MISVATKTMKTKGKYKEKQRALLKFGSNYAIIWQAWFGNSVL